MPPVAFAARVAQRPAAMKHLPVVLTLLLASTAVYAQPTGNLIPDASFESPAPAWFSEEGKGSYFAAKEKVAGAADGNFVLAIEGWENSGSRILSAPLDLPTDTLSAIWKVRSFGNAPGAEAELALFDAQGEQKLSSLGTYALNGNGQWNEIKANGVKLDTPAARGRVALVLSGPQEGARVEVDQAGLFAGGTLGEVSGKTDFVWFEAEEMAVGKSWFVQDHYLNAYADLPSGMKMLAGPDTVSEAENRPAVKTVTVSTAGRHRLWVRVVHNVPVIASTYTVSLKQNGQAVASKEMNDGDDKLGPGYNWIWIALDADLAAGDTEVVLTRPAGGVSWMSRKVDLFVLTNQLSYQPQMDDFKPKGYLRFTNTSTGQEPYCLWAFVQHHQAPDYFATPGILSDAGWSRGYYVPADKTKWLQQGESTPWVNISQFLRPAGGRNNIQFLATRYLHTSGFVERGFQGTLEFAVGEDHRIVKKVQVNQNAPRLLMTLPYDMQKSGEIRTPGDYLKQAEAALDKIGKPLGRVAKHLELASILSLDAGLDDPAVIERELNVLKRLGLNNTLYPLTDPKDAPAFHAKHGLLDSYGLWAGGFAYKNNCMNQPDIEQMEAEFKRQCEKFAPVRDKIRLMYLADEPSGPTYEHLASCEVCKSKFREGLKAQGLAPTELGVGSWQEVSPVLPENKEKQPMLFYYTGLFRLRTLADLAKASVAIKNKYFPANANTFVNYSPPLSDQLTWTQRGNDLWMLHRDGGLEMGYTEDWLGYGMSPQQISPLYAQLRAAGAPTHQPLGGHVVMVSGGPLLQRLKYYAAVAAGVRYVNLFNYGPYYSSNDPWSTAYNLYPTISRVQHELGAIDEALNNTTRHKTDIAILYNRTAGIWMHNATNTEQDSRYTHFALAHAGYDASFIAEEDIVAGGLSKYKVLYLNGVQIRRDAANKIAAWVRDGGVLSGSAGAGTRDEYNRPFGILEKVFGASSQNLKLENDAGRPKYELRTLPILDQLSTAPGSGSPAVSFNQLSYRETLAPLANAKVILKNKAGEAAGVLNTFGKGTAIRVAALPAITYLNDAVRDEKYDADSYLPKKYRKELRDFIVWPAMIGKAFRVAHASAPITEITRYDGKANSKTGSRERVVFFVVDYNAEFNSNFSITLPEAGQFTKAYTASGKPVTIKKGANNSLMVSFSLDIADALVLE